MTGVKSDRRLAARRCSMVEGGSFITHLMSPPGRAGRSMRRKGRQAPGDGPVGGGGGD